MQIFNWMYLSNVTFSFSNPTDPDQNQSLRLNFNFPRYDNRDQWNYVVRQTAEITT